MDNDRNNYTVDELSKSVKKVSTIELILLFAAVGVAFKAMKDASPARDRTETAVR